MKKPWRIVEEVYGLKGADAAARDLEEGTYYSVTVMFRSDPFDGRDADAMVGAAIGLLHRRLQRLGKDDLRTSMKAMADELVRNVRKAIQEDAEAVPLRRAETVVPGNGSEQ